MILKNKVVIVTGGGARIGKMSAIVFAKEGETVAVADMNERSGVQTVEEINNMGRKAVFFKLDVTQEGDWKQEVAKTVTAFGSIHILFNKCGMFAIKPAY